jgi:hypothetical protein
MTERKECVHTLCSMKFIANGSLLAKTTLHLFVRVCYQRVLVLSI